MAEHEPYSIEELLARYDQVTVPESLRTMDPIGDMSEDGKYNVIETTHDFFDRIMASLQLSRRALAHVLEFESRMLVPLDRSRASDDIVTELRVKYVQTIATTLRTRDDWNWQVTHFAKYPLIPRATRAIAAIADLGGAAPDTQDETTPRA